MDAGRGEIESTLRYSFRDGELLRRALTHKSRAFEASARGEGPPENNEQLEFLGDAVLGFVVSEALVERHPELSEGRLSKAKARLVSTNHLHRVARKLRLGDFLILGRGEEMNGGREKRALLADSMEALIAAVYLDGGYAAARKFILEHIVGELGVVPDDADEMTDFKGALQELAQSRKQLPPRYRVVSTSGPEHSKRFLVEVSVGDTLTAQAEGSSKKMAGQQAARILLRRMSQVACQ